MEAINYLFIYISRTLYISINMFLPWILFCLILIMLHDLKKKKAALLQYNSYTIKFSLLKYSIQWLLEYSHSHTTNTIILIPEHFYHPQKKPIRRPFPYPSPQPWQLLIYFLFFLDLPILKCHMNGIIQYMIDFLA